MLAVHLALAFHLKRFTSWTCTSMIIILLNWCIQRQLVLYYTILYCNIQIIRIGHNETSLSFFWYGIMPPNFNTHYISLVIHVSQATLGPSLTFQLPPCPFKISHASGGHKRPLLSHYSLFFVKKKGRICEVLSRFASLSFSNYVCAKRK